jgi:hypothetical protein
MVQFGMAEALPAKRERLARTECIRHCAAPPRNKYAEI